MTPEELLRSAMVPGNPRSTRQFFAVEQFARTAMSAVSPTEAVGKTARSTGLTAG